MFFTSYPTLRAVTLPVRTHIGKSPAWLAARMGVKEIGLETQCSDAKLGAAEPAPEL